MQNVLERKSIKNIDFNCDLAQSFGIYKNSSESRLLDYVSSVNIACGFHAGDPLTIKEALLTAKEKNIVVGAHIGEEESIPVAHEVHLEKIYDENGNIDFSARDLENTHVSIQRLRDLLQNSQVTNNVGGKTIVRADSIHFSNKLSNAKDLIVQAREITEPLPFNYRNALKSGWVN